MTGADTAYNLSPMDYSGRMAAPKLYAIKLHLAESQAEALLLEEIAERIRQNIEIEPKMLDGTPVKIFYRENPKIVNQLMYDSELQSLYLNSLNKEISIHNLHRLLKYGSSEKEQADFVYAFEVATGVKIPVDTITSDSIVDDADFARSTFYKHVNSAVPREQLKKVIEGSVNGDSLAAPNTDSATDSNSTDKRSADRFWKLWKKVSAELPEDSWLRGNFHKVLQYTSPETVPCLMEAGVVLKRMSDEEKELLRTLLLKQVRGTLEAHFNEQTYARAVNHAFSRCESGISAGMSSIRAQGVSDLAGTGAPRGRTLTNGKSSSPPIIDAHSCELTLDNLPPRREFNSIELHGILMADLNELESGGKIQWRTAGATVKERSF